MLSNRTLFLVLTMTLPALAGCAGDGGGDDNPVDACNPQVEDCDDLLKAGKGAIAGLLVDDRFRPIQITDDAATEFQAEGFVLLQETGEQVQTTENGEFNFLDVEPGDYTIRVQASGHEVTPQKVRVVEGEFAETTIIARRTVSEGSTIITESYAAFASCFANAIALSYRLECTNDESGDTDRSGFRLNYTGLDDVTWVVAEALFNQYPQGGASFDIVMRDPGPLDSFTAAVLWEDRYARVHLQHGEISPDPVPPGDAFVPWYANETFTLEMFGRGYGAEEIRTGYEPVYSTLQSAPCIPTVATPYCANELPMRRGVGGALGVEATFLVSVFLGEPEVDPMQYCGICDPDA